MSFFESFNEYNGFNNMVGNMQRINMQQNQEREIEQTQRLAAQQEETNRLLKAQDERERQRIELEQQKHELEQREIAAANEYRSLLGYSQQVLALLQARI